MLAWYKNVFGDNVLDYIGLVLGLEVSNPNKIQYCERFAIVSGSGLSEIHLLTAVARQIHKP